MTGSVRNLWRVAGTGSTTWYLKRVLMSMLVVGGLSMFTFANVFAVFTTETRNTGGTIASGTLTLTGTANASTCFSYTGASASGNSNSGCAALFTNSTLFYPGDAATVNVTITNSGTLNGSSLTVYMPTCTTVSSPSAPSPGGGNACANGGPMVYIDESNSTFTAHSCVYPTVGGTCSYLANTLSYLASQKNSSSTSYALPGGIAAGASRYFIIGMKMPTTASNTLQGEAAKFDLTWHLSQ